MCVSGARRPETCELDQAELCQQYTYSIVRCVAQIALIITLRVHGTWAVTAAGIEKVAPRGGSATVGVTSRACRLDFASDVAPSGSRLRLNTVSVRLGLASASRSDRLCGFVAESVRRRIGPPFSCVD